MYTDYCDGQLRSLVPHLRRASGDRKLGLSVDEPGSFGDDTRGRVYVTSLAGPVYRLVSALASRSGPLQLADQPKGIRREHPGGERHGGEEHGDERRDQRRQRGDATAEQIDVLNPATGETVGSIEVDTPETVAATVARVRANQAEWEALGIEGRYHWLGKLRDWMLDNTERIADTMQAETGKVRADASARARLPRRPDQLLRHQGGQVHRRGNRPRPTRRCWPRRSSVSSTGPTRWSA